VYGTIYNLCLLVGVNVFETLYTATGASLKKSMPAALGPGPWVPGFSHAYLFGAGACLVSLLLASGISLRNQHGNSARGWS